MRRRNSFYRRFAESFFNSNNFAILFFNIYFYRIQGTVSARRDMQGRHVTSVLVVTMVTLTASGVSAARRAAQMKTLVKDHANAR